jgi:hypothetical protein
MCGFANMPMRKMENLKYLLIYCERVRKIKLK